MHGSPVQRLLRKNGTEILRNAKQAKKLLRSSRYYTNRNRRFGILCHGDGGPSNFVRNANGTYLLDFETLQVNLRAYDLYRLVFNCCKDHRWRFSIARAILDGYRQFSKLRKADYKQMKAWLRFPIMDKPRHQPDSCLI